LMYKLQSRWVPTPASLEKVWTSVLVWYDLMMMRLLRVASYKQNPVNQLTPIIIT
jgi:hypothetical protein